MVAAFTRAYVRGMHGVGMAATLKHFPGHGTVLEDTHFDDAVDPRPLDVLRAEDLVPFAAGIEAGADAVMMAHVAYPQVAPEPAGYSRRWIEEILRAEMGFRGVVFSDDIGMAAAYSAGGVKARIDAHLDAGCDVVPGLPSRTGRGIPARGRRPPPQHCRAHRPDRPRCAGLGRPAGRRPLRRRAVAPAVHGRLTGPPSTTTHSGSPIRCPNS